MVSIPEHLSLLTGTGWGPHYKQRCSSLATLKSFVLSRFYKATLFVSHPHYSRPLSSGSEKKILHREKNPGGLPRVSLEFQQTQSAQEREESNHG